MECITKSLISELLGLSLKLGDLKYFDSLKIWFSISIYLNPGGILKYTFSVSSPSSASLASK